MAEDSERRDQTVRVRVGRGDLEAWKRAAGPLGSVSGWLREAATRVMDGRVPVAGAELERGVPVEVVELRATGSEATSWREAAGSGGVASWLRSVAARELHGELRSIGAPVPADAKIPDPVPAGTASPVPAARSGGPGHPDTPVPSTGLLEAPATSAPSARPFAGEDAEDRRRRSMTLAEVLACPHPADDWKKLGYATICVACGRRQQGRDLWIGAGYAGWDKAKLAACPHPPAERRQLARGASCGVCGALVR